MFNRSANQGSTKFWIDYLSQSELNCVPRKIGQRDRLSKSIYSSFELFSGYDQTKLSPSSLACPNRGSKKSHGSIYDLCFTPGTSA